MELAEPGHAVVKREEGGSGSAEPALAGSSAGGLQRAAAATRVQPDSSQPYSLPPRCWSRATKRWPRGYSYHARDRSYSTNMSYQARCPACCKCCCRGRLTSRASVRLQGKTSFGLSCSSEHTVSEEAVVKWEELWGTGTTRSLAEAQADVHSQASSPREHMP